MRHQIYIDHDWSVIGPGGLREARSGRRCFRNAAETEIIVLFVKCGTPPYIPPRFSPKPNHQRKGCAYMLRVHGGKTQSLTIITVNRT